MTENNIHISNDINNDLYLTPLEYASLKEEQYSSSKNIKEKKKIGQFFTPSEIAFYMASFVSNFSGKSEIDILDPGAGLGMLSCAVIERITNDLPNVQVVNLKLYEIDIEVVHELKGVMIYLKKWARERGVRVKVKIVELDFVLCHKGILDKNNATDKFDLVISNPPYFKLSKGDKRSLAVERIIFGQPNIYSMFMAISACQLKSDGELIFISPRSFTSGKYFKKFREYFFKLISISDIHIFESRNIAFKKDKVLQETIMFKGVNRTNNNTVVSLSYSKGILDLFESRCFKCPELTMIDLNSMDKSFYLPASPEDIFLLEKFSKLKNRLTDLDLKASTGPVVFFRNLDFLRNKRTKNVVPLIWLNNVHSMNLKWPNKEFEKPQFIDVVKSSQKVLVKSSNCVLLRRFSAKGDKKRLVACSLDKEVSKKYNYVGIENKVNYIHKINNELTYSESIGISALLTSSYYNRYFLMLNGNTNVSVTELNQIPFPSLDIISKIGESLIKKGFTENNIENEIQYIFK